MEAPPHESSKQSHYDEWGSVTVLLPLGHCASDHASSIHPTTRGPATNPTSISALRLGQVVPKQHRENCMVPFALQCTRIKCPLEPTGFLGNCLIRQPTERGARVQDQQ